MQEETLKLVLLALEDGAALSRKVLVMFVVQKLEQQFPQASKTSVGHVVQLLYRASCFKVTKRNEESSLMQLKDEVRFSIELRIPGWSGFWVWAPPVADFTKQLQRIVAAKSLAHSFIGYHKDAKTLRK